MRSKDTEIAVVKLPRCLVCGGMKVEWGIYYIFAVRGKQESDFSNLGSGTNRICCRCRASVVEGVFRAHDDDVHNESRVYYFYQFGTSSRSRFALNFQ